MSFQLLYVEQLGPQRRLFLVRQLIAVFGTMPGNQPPQFIRDDSNTRQDLSYCSFLKASGDDTQTIAQ
jgi:hypothetical protein